MATKIDGYYEKYKKNGIINFDIIKTKLKVPSDFTQLDKFIKEYDLCVDEFTDIMNKWNIILPLKLVKSFIEFLGSTSIKCLDLNKIDKAKTNIFNVAYKKLGIPLRKELDRILENA